MLFSFLHDKQISQLNYSISLKLSVKMKQTKLIYLFQMLEDIHKFSLTNFTYILEQKEYIKYKGYSNPSVQDF